MALAELVVGRCSSLETRERWSRDDPAFLLCICFFMAGKRYQCVCANACSVPFCPSLWAYCLFSYNDVSGLYNVYSHFPIHDHQLKLYKPKQGKSSNYVLAIANIALNFYVIVPDCFMFCFGLNFGTDGSLYWTFDTVN